MNRLAPLVARTPRSFARARLAAIGPVPPTATTSDLRLFVTAWLGGVVFFTTLLA